MTKEESRKKYRELRKEFSHEQLSTMSVKIARLCISQFQFNDFKAVHLFLPIKETAEVDTYELLTRLDKQFPLLKICVPRSNFEDNTMEHVVMKSSMIITANSYNIPEPQNGKTYDKDFDLIIVPLLAYDKKGNRVGYGKGFYDRFLENQPNAIKVGLSFFPPEDIISDAESHDQPLDYCITPSEIYKFS